MSAATSNQQPATSYQLPATSYQLSSRPADRPLAVFVALRKALRLLDSDVLRAGHLRHPLDPSCDARAARGLRWKIRQADAGAVLGLFLHPELPAVVERGPHVRRLGKQRRRRENE